MGRVERALALLDARFTEETPTQNSGNGIIHTVSYQRAQLMLVRRYKLLNRINCCIQD